MNERRISGIVFVFACFCAFAFSSCTSTPAVVINTTPVDNAITDAMNIAGDLEVQTVTIYQTVEKLIYAANPEEKALVKKQFAEKQLSETLLKANIKEIARLHGIEIGKLATEINRLQPFEVESEKQKAEKWKAYALLGIIGAIATCYAAIKIFKLF